MTRPRGQLTTYRARGQHATDWANPTHWLNRMESALIVLARSFRSHCPTVQPTVSDSEKLPPIVRPSLTCQTTADHLRFSFSRDASSPTSDFTPDPPISYTSGNQYLLTTETESASTAKPSHQHVRDALTKQTDKCPTTYTCSRSEKPVSSC